MLLNSLEDLILPFRSCSNDFEQSKYKSLRNLLSILHGMIELTALRLMPTLLCVSNNILVIFLTLSH